MANSVNPPGEGAPGDEGVLGAILDAAERLFASAGPANVSLRAIAAESGVTYGLVHHYFDSKYDLFDRVLQRYEDRWIPKLESLDYSGALDVLFGPGPDTGAPLRLLAWTLLRENGDTNARETAAHRKHATLDRLIGMRDEAGTDEAAIDTASALAFIFGWRFFNTFIRDALHLHMNEAELHETMRRRLHLLTTAQMSARG